MVVADPHVVDYFICRLTDKEMIYLDSVDIYSTLCLSCMFSVGHVGVYYRVSETKSGVVNILIFKCTVL